jgi:adenosylcobinamide-GDP ribazoletransferase
VLLSDARKQKSLTIHFSLPIVSILFLTQLMMSFQSHWRALAAAVMFLTRLPLPERWQYDPSYLRSAYFPLVGLFIGIFAALCYSVASIIWPQSIAVALSMAITIWATGAFHEDGFADSCDGFGGGWNKEQILKIMQDSRLGTYGCTGLLLILALKFLALNALPAEKLVVALLIGHSLSRLLSISHLYDLSYVRFEGKSKPVGTQLGSGELGWATLSVAGLWILIPLSSLIAILTVLLIWRFWFGRYMRRWIGGYTGDCLGASQQVSEVLIYLILAASW